MENTSTIKVFVDENGGLPKRFTSGAAGYDIYSSEETLLKPNSTTLFSGVNISNRCVY